MALLSCGQQTQAIRSIDSTPCSTSSAWRKMACNPHMSRTGEHWFAFNVEASELWRVTRYPWCCWNNAESKVFFQSVLPHLKRTRTARISVTSYFSSSRQCLCVLCLVSLFAIPARAISANGKKSDRPRLELKGVYFAVNHWPSSSDMSFWKLETKGIKIIKR